MSQSIKDSSKNTQTIYFKDIYNTFSDYAYLIDFYHQNKERMYETIEISFERVKWLAANACSSIGAIIQKLMNSFNRINIYDINNNKVKDILARNGFLAFLGQERTHDSRGTTIRFLKLSPTQGRFFSNYIQEELLAKQAMPQMSARLKKKIFEGIYEIFMNAAIHSDTQEGIFACGQFFPGHHRIEFTLTDLGIGIKNRVNRYLNASFSAEEAIEWAIQERNTTKGGDSGGLGLSILKQFISLNKGSMQIISNDGFWELSEKGISKNHFQKDFPGTVVNICFKTDDPMKYMLKEEIIDDAELF